MHSPAGSLGNNSAKGSGYGQSSGYGGRRSNQGHSPVVTMTNQNQRVRRVGLAAGGGGGGGAGMLRSPSVVSDSSKKSIRSSGYG